MPSSIVARMPAAKIATNTTSATPIMSADAVTAVRCGWRRAFSRASRPVRPRMRSSGLPTRLLSGRTSVAATSAKPNISSTAPRPSVEAVAFALPVSPNRLNSITATPSSASSTAATIRRRRSLPPPGVSASRMAATGSTRVARRAGTKPDTTVATMPTTGRR